MYIFAKIRFIAILLVFFVISGCSSFSKVSYKTKKIVNAVSFSGRGLKKKIGILEVREKPQFQQALAERLEQICPDISRKKISGAENSDNLSIAQIGRSDGLNAVIRGRVGMINVSREEKGFPMFKRFRYEASVSASLEMYDTTTAAKISDETLTRSMEIEEADAEMIKSGGQISSGIFEAAIAEMASELALNACELISKQDWRGYVVSIDKSIIRLSSGREAGLQPGAMLEVYDPGEPIQGLEGQQFFKYGVKIAEIKVMSVSDHHSDALVFSGKGVREGCWVKEK